MEGKWKCLDLSTRHGQELGLYTVSWDSLKSIFQNFIGKPGSVCKVNQTNICLPVNTTSLTSFILFGCRLWLLINVCRDFITTALVSYDPCDVREGWPGLAAADITSVTENTSQVRAVCQITGVWSGVSMTCMADPAYSGGNDPPWQWASVWLNLLRWRHPLAWEEGSQHEYRHHHQYSQRYHLFDHSRHHPHCLGEEEQDLTG